MKGFHSMVRWCVVFTACLLCSYANAASPSAGLSVEAFSTLPQFEDVQLSPDGNKIAYLRHVKVKDEPVALLQVYDFTKKKPYYLLSSDGEKVKINWYHWANNQKLAVSARYESKQGTAKFFRTRLYLMNYEQSDKKPQPVVSPMRLRHRKTTHVPQFMDTVVDWLPDDPGHILMAIDLDEAFSPSVYKVSVNDYGMQRIERAKRNIRTWISDQQGKVRLGISLNYSTGEQQVLIEQEDDWEPLFEYNAMEEKGFYPRGFGLDPNILYYSAYKGDYLALYKMNLKKRQSELVFADENYDVDGSLIYSSQSGDAIGVRHAQAPNGRHYWDKRWAVLQEMVDEAMPDYHNVLVSFNQDESRYILLSQADAKPPVYSIGDVGKKQLNVLFYQYPQLHDTPLPEHRKVAFTARDGLTIEGYLTLPLNGKAPYPTIIHPHGGPGARDYDGFDYWTSYFVSRGYAVLRPNFRGSSGYGYNFAQAQMKGWGLQMQDDITDATRYLISEGIADADKLCIVGASYGGYAALMATVKTPELFTCAVSFAGVADLKQLVRNSRHFLNKEFVKNQIGDDYDDLEQRSPVYHADEIKTPILLIHGDEDRAVPVAHSRDMAEELKDAGNRHFRYVELPAGDHYLSLQNNRHQFFNEMDTFLSRHLQ